MPYITKFPPLIGKTAKMKDTENEKLYERTDSENSFTELSPAADYRQSYIKKFSQLI